MLRAMRREIQHGAVAVNGRMPHAVIEIFKCQLVNLELVGRPRRYGAGKYLHRWLGSGRLLFCAREKKCGSISSDGKTAFTATRVYRCMKGADFSENAFTIECRFVGIKVASDSTVRRKYHFAIV